MAPGDRTCERLQLTLTGQRELMCRNSNDTIPSFDGFLLSCILHPEELFRFVAFVLRVVLRGYEISWLKVWFLH